jgi:diacylglycerol kinase family enzyme
MSGADLCIIYNPAAGRKQAASRIARLRRLLGARADFRPTTAPGMAEELARAAAVEGFPIVGAAGGDGTVHEVGNGLVRSGRSDVILAVLPVGSANDYAHSLGLDTDWWRKDDPAITVRPLDVGVVRSGARERHFLNGLGLGFNGAVTLESRKIQRLQGLLLYGLAFVRAFLFHYRAVPMTVRLDNEEPRTGPTLALSLAIGRREGNFIVAPSAVLDDGLFDFIHVGNLRRRDVIAFVPGLISGGLRTDHPIVRVGRCRQASVRSTEPLTVHIDGEFFCRPEDDVRDLEIECLPRRLRVFTRSQCK